MPANGFKTGGTAQKPLATDLARAHDPSCKALSGPLTPVLPVEGVPGWFDRRSASRLALLHTILFVQLQV